MNDMGTRITARSLTLLLASCFAAAPPALAAPVTAPATNSAQQGANTEELTATITGIEGLVQVRLAEGQPWQTAKNGMVVSVGGEFRTGPRSGVRFVIPPDQVVALDRLGTIKLIDAIRDQNRVKTDLGMKYGRARYDIEAAGLEHQSVIHSPGSTLAVRGTKVGVFNQGFYPIQVWSLTGQAVAGGPGQTNGKKFGSKGGTLVNLQPDQNNAAQTEVTHTGVESQSAFGNTQAENLLNLSLAAYGGANFADLGVLALLDEARSGNFAGTVTGSLPVGEMLEFRLTWAADPGTDVNLIVTSPLGEIVRDGANQVASSGQHNGDGVADQFNFGEESATWTVSFPPGHYSVRAELASGTSAAVNLQAVQDPFGRGDTIHNADFILSSQTPTHTEVVTAPGAPVGGH